jgi:hypothetical protein
VTQKVNRGFHSRCVIRAGGGQKLAIGTERHVLHRVL